VKKTNFSKYVKYAVKVMLGKIIVVFAIFVSAMAGHAGNRRNNKNK
jgi:hypothetical protein